MVQVRKHGNTYKDTKCEKCEALLAYCKTDIKIDSKYEEYWGNYHCSYRQYIICPECDNQIEISWMIDGKEQIKHEETK